MGQSLGVICNACGVRFRVSDGGGFVFHLLHCDRCGTERSIGFDEIGEPHLRYLKGLKVPYAMATADHDLHVEKHYRGEPITEAEYHRIVEDLCGECECGGSFRFDAPARCPECGSADHRRDPEAGVVMYD
jgi:hypothetical protein